MFGIDGLFAHRQRKGLLSRIQIRMGGLLWNNCILIGVDDYGYLDSRCGDPIMKQIKLMGSIKLIDGKHVIDKWIDWGNTSSYASIIKQSPVDLPIKIDDVFSKVENKRIVLIITETF